MKRQRQKSKPAPLAVEFVEVGKLKPHPRNYRKHPEDQLEHLVQSIKDHGFYRNVVAAKDWTVLAGHGVVEAAMKMGLKTVPVIRLPLAPDDPRALKVVIADNEISNLAEVDDRELTELLKELNESDIGLLGTGFDEAQLASLVFVTRPASEVESQNRAAQWVGMPEYEEGENPIRLIVSFGSREDREEFVESISLPIKTKQERNWLTRWPTEERKKRGTRDAIVVDNAADEDRV